jgi:hypothetical protein
MKLPPSLQPWAGKYLWAARGSAPSPLATCWHGFTKVGWTARSRAKAMAAPLMTAKSMMTSSMPGTQPSSLTTAEIRGVFAFGRARDPYPHLDAEDLPRLWNAYVMSSREIPMSLSTSSGDSPSSSVAFNSAFCSARRRSQSTRGPTATRGSFTSIRVLPSPLQETTRRKLVPMPRCVCDKTHRPLVSSSYPPLPRLCFHCRVRQNCPAARFLETRTDAEKSHGSGFVPNTKTDLSH